MDIINYVNSEILLNQLSYNVFNIFIIDDHNILQWFKMDDLYYGSLYENKFYMFINATNTFYNMDNICFNNKIKLLKKFNYDTMKIVNVKVNNNIIQTYNCIKVFYNVYSKYNIFYYLSINQQNINSLGNNYFLNIENSIIYLNNITILKCSFNNINNLDNLPDTLIELECSHNKITELNNLPKNLTELHCSHNYIKYLDNLPINLKKLICDNNCIKTLDKLPQNLYYLSCSNNLISKLNKLPRLLRILISYNNLLYNINNLPIYLVEFVYNVSKIVNNNELNIFNSELNTCLPPKLNRLCINFIYNNLPYALSNLTLNYISIYKINNIVLPEHINTFYLEIDNIPSNILLKINSYKKKKTEQYFNMLIYNNIHIIPNSLKNIRINDITINIDDIRVKIYKKEKYKKIKFYFKKYFKNYFKK